MNDTFPFFVGLLQNEGEQVFHTHPRCRIAEMTAAADRRPGMGTGLRQCPFCFLMGQFQANRELRATHYAGPASHSLQPQPAAEREANDSSGSHGSLRTADARGEGGDARGRMEVRFI